MALGIIAGGLLAGSKCIGPGQGSRQHPCQFTHSYRPHRRQVRIEIPAEQGVNFVQRAVFHHYGKTPVAAVVKPLAVGKQDDRHESNTLSDPTAPVPLPICQRAPGRSYYFECTSDSGGVRRVQRRRPGRILVAQGSVGLGNVHRPDLCADSRVDGRDRRDSIQQCSDVQARSSHQDRQCVLCVRFGDGMARGIGPIRGRAGLRRVPLAEQPVGYAAHFFSGRSRAQYLEIGIDLRAVGVDDNGGFPPFDCSQRQPDGQIALAAGGRPCNERQRRPCGRFEKGVLSAHRPADSRTFDS